MDLGVGDRIPVLLSIDIEPDPREPGLGAPAPLRGTERLFQLLDGVRGALARTCAAPPVFSWYVRADPQIEHVYGDRSWLMRTFASELAAAQSRGDHVGLHTHAQRWDEARAQWISDYENREWLEHCLRMSFDAFEGFFAYGCTCFRFGDAWINDRALDFLRSLGVKVDLSIEPDQPAAPYRRSDEEKIGPVPEPANVPMRPLWWRSGGSLRALAEEGACAFAAAGAADGSPSARPGGGGDRGPGLWIVPISTAAITLASANGNTGRASTGDRSARWRRFLPARDQAKRWNAYSRRLPFVHHLRERPLVERVGGKVRAAYGGAFNVTLNLIADPVFFAPAFEAVLAKVRPCYVHMVCRSGDLANRWYRANFERNLAYVAAHDKAARFLFTTPLGLLSELGLE
ncbi:MAG: hypothetical protein WCF16_08825 [Alphaproteobacteria bacterium]